MIGTESLTPTKKASVVCINLQNGGMGEGFSREMSLMDFAIGLFFSLFFFACLLGQLEMPLHLVDLQNSIPRLGGEGRLRRVHEIMAFGISCLQSVAIYFSIVKESLGCIC